MGKGAFIYILATILQTGGTFVFLGLATRMLDAQNYGQWALLEPLLLVGGQIVTLGLNSGVIKLIAQDGRQPGEVFRRVGRAGLVVSVGIALVLAALIGLSLKLGGYALVLFAILIGEGRYSVLLNTLRGGRLGNRYAAVVAARAFAVVLTMGVLFVTPFRHELDGRNLSYVWLSALLFSLVFSAWLNRRPEAAAQVDATQTLTDWAGYQVGVKYGAPILAATVLSAVLANADRYVLAGRVGDNLISQYVLAGKTAAILNLCVTPLNLWWPTARFQHLKDADGGAVYFSSASATLCAALAALSAAVFIFAPELLKLLAPSAIFDVTVTGLLCLGAFFIAMSVPMNVGGLKHGHTHWVTVAVAVAAGSQVVLALLLVPLFGLHGAALSTMLSSLLSLAFQNFVSQRIHLVPFKYAKMIFTVVAWCALAVIAVNSGSGLPMRVAIYALGALIQFAVLQLPRFAQWRLQS